jgi:PAS domain S-box-containing protein
MLQLDDKYLHRLIESSPDIIVAVDRQGTIIYYNDGARTNLHFVPGEIIGQNVSRLYESLDEARRVMKAMRESPNVGRVSSFETVFRDKEGNLIPVAISGSLIFDEGGYEIGSIGFARDIRILRRREQLATAGEIAVSLAHEINNPLEAILNNLELVARSFEGHLSAAEQVIEDERVGSIRGGIARVQEIVRRLDEMTKKGVYETRDYLQGRRMTDLAPRHLPHDDPPRPPESGGPGEWPLKGMNVLVVDDDVAVLNSLADLLRAERCVVMTAERPSAALGLLRNMKVDAVISDVVMPEMDGYEFYLKVKDEMPGLPVILMTAYYYDKDHIMKRSRLEGLKFAFFKKPINLQKLRQILVDVRPHPAPQRPGLFT